jgi:hypothetical protein
MEAAVTIALGRRRLPLRERVQQLLKERKIPFVNVDEAKKALFASARLGAFHFVAYQKAGPNWLIWAAHLTRQSRMDLMEWEKIFGDGFVGVVARENAARQIAFKTLAGEVVELR